MDVKLVGLKVERSITFNLGKDSYSSVRIGATPYFELEGADVADLGGIFSDVQDELKAAIGEALKPFMPYVSLYKAANGGKVEVEELFQGKPVERD